MADIIQELNTYTRTNARRRKKSHPKKW